MSFVNGIPQPSCGISNTYVHMFIRYQHNLIGVSVFGFETDRRNEEVRCEKLSLTRSSLVSKDITA